MTTEGVKRKLTAILSADVKGYSRLMGEDEVGTIQMLKAYQEAMASLIKQHPWLAPGYFRKCGSADPPGNWLIRDH